MIDKLSQQAPSAFGAGEESARVGVTGEPHGGGGVGSVEQEGGRGL